MRPSGTEDLDDQELARLITRDSLVGASVPQAPNHPIPADA
jgi:hypothetical protein